MISIKRHSNSMIKSRFIEIFQS